MSTAVLRSDSYGGGAGKLNLKPKNVQKYKK